MKKRSLIIVSIAVALALAQFVVVYYVVSKHKNAGGPSIDEQTTSVVADEYPEPRREDTNGVVDEAVLVEELPEESSETETEIPEKRIPVLDAEKCISCGICARRCPEHAITMVNGRPVIDPEKCTSCGICVKVCPTKAFSFPEDD